MKQEVNVGVTSGPVSAHFPRRLGRLDDFYFLLLEFGATSSWCGEDLEDGNVPRAAADLLNETLLMMKERLMTCKFQRG